MSVAFVKVCATLGITQTFASDNNPKGNADAERLMRTLKAELLWLRERTSALDLERGTDGVGRLVQHEDLQSALRHSVRGRLTNGEH